MIQLVLVGVGGFIGAVLRFVTSEFVQRFNPGAFPLGTLAVNMLGCLLIGLLAGLAETRGIFTAESRSLVMVGLLGAFTTFSTFSYETATLLRDGLTGHALLNVGIQIALGLVAVWIGLRLAQ